MSSQLFVLILAGGSGERFWPLSRRTRPKQLLALFSEGSLLEGTLKRLDGLVPLENVLILTNRDQEPAVRKLVPQLPFENIIAEPAKRDTAAAIALGVGCILARDPSATMVVLPADHLIRDTASFHRTIRVAASAAETTGELVTIGIKPTWACPGFGYIEQGEKVAIPGGNADADVREVIRFREKPNADLAEMFVRQGNFRWNAGMFIWSIRSIVSAFNRYTPELAEFIGQIHQTKDLSRLLDERFQSLPKISIDYAIMEKASRVLVVAAEFDWDDVGSWTAVAKYLENHGQNNLSNVPVTALNSSNMIVFSDQKIRVALLGVSDLIVVRTGDALLICARHEAERIKELVATVPADLQ